MKYATISRGRLEHITEGFHRLREHPAMVATLDLARKLLAFQCPPESIQYKADRAAAQAIDQLRIMGVTAEALVIRLAVVADYLMTRPAPNEKAERYVWGRTVTYAVAYPARARKPGALCFNQLGHKVLESGLAGAVAKFTERLRKDASRAAEVSRQANDWS